MLETGYTGWDQLELKELTGCKSFNDFFSTELKKVQKIILLRSLSRLEPFNEYFV